MHRVRPFVIVPLLLGPVVSFAVPAGLSCPAVEVASGPAAASVVELYTSEGCNSCPPADRWMSRLDFARHGVLPLAFHVDYWDYIGWQDRFARPAYSARQREAVRRQGARTAYTPQVLLDGRDERAWFDAGRFGERLAALAKRPARVHLTLRAEVARGRARVRIATREALPPGVALFVAVTENRLASRVTAGENRGSELRHDHVVRAFAGPQPAPAEASFALGEDWKPADLAIAAFAEDAASGEVLQAVQAPLCAR